MRLAMQGRLVAKCSLEGAPNWPVACKLGKERVGDRTSAAAAAADDEDREEEGNVVPACCPSRGPTDDG